MSALEAVGLDAGYGRLVVVRELDLCVHPGEVVALLGRNGAGKTTTLATLAGLLPALGGEVLLSGVSTAAPLQDRVRRGLALVTDSRSVFSRLSVRDNLRLGRGAPEHALGLFPELGPLLNLQAGLLSGGQQQMLAIGRALAAGPDVLLVDELSLGLAPLVVGRLLEAVRAAADRGAAVLLVEQYARLVLDVVDRAYLLVNGTVAMHGSAEEFRRDLGDIERHYLATVT